MLELLELLRLQLLVVRLRLCRISSLQMLQRLRWRPRACVAEKGTEAIRQTLERTRPRATRRTLLQLHRLHVLRLQAVRGLQLRLRRRRVLTVRRLKLRLVGVKNLLLLRRLLLLELRLVGVKGLLLSLGRGGWRGRGGSLRVSRSRSRVSDRCVGLCHRLVGRRCRRRGRVRRFHGG